jgi:hypothetical protein
MIKTLGYGCVCGLLLVAVPSFAEQPPPVPVADQCQRLVPDLELGDQVKVREALQSLSSEDFSAYEGQRIRRILYDTIDVFDERDPDENNWLYRFVNRLHINTKPGVIEAQLLFTEGDEIHLPLIQETERILRTRGYLTNAFIVPAAVCDDGVDLLVVTQDAWSLEPRVSFSRKADDSESGFGLNDDNILGSGNSVTIMYEEMADRNSISYSFSNPHFMNKPIAVRVSYAETSDGNNTLLNVAHPFYSLNTPWAASFLAQDIYEIKPIRSRGEKINEFRHRIMVQEGYFGSAFHVTETATHRWYMGMSKEEDRFFEIEETTMGIPENRKTVYPWIAYEFIENRYGVFKNLNQIQRTEDLSLGLTGDFRFGYGGRSLDGADEVVRYKGQIRQTYVQEADHVLQMGFYIDAYQRLESGKKSYYLTGADVAYNYFIDPNNRWYAHLRLDTGDGLAQYQELTAGDTSGMRGYPTDFQRGDKRFLFSLERRYFSDWHIFNLMRVGGVAFMDVGRAWGVPGQENNPLLANIGLGIRLSSSKVRVGNVIHINIAAPVTQRDGISKSQLLISAQQSF